MATDLSYQKASRIRGTSFGDLLSDQLMDAPTIRGAIGKTISLKTKARIKGIKEKFDPLNIAKFLTGGSSLGPALLGRLTGRSEKDIQYFSGRMRPIRDRGTASRIGKDPSMGTSEGVSDMLKKIYYLMQITRESDLQRRDVEMNFDEERKIEAEKRHKELLKVLSGLGGKTATVVEEKSRQGMMDAFLDLLKKIPAIPIPTGAGKGLGKLLSGASRFLLSAPVLAILGVAGTAWLLKKLYENDTPEGEETAISQGKTDSQLALEVGPEGPPRVRPKVEDVAKERKIENRMADFRLRLRNMGADERRTRIYLRDYEESQDPIDKEAAIRLLAEIKPLPPKMTAADFQRMDKDTTPVPVPEPTSGMQTSLAPVAGTNLGARLGAVTNENVAANLPVAAAPAQNVVNNVTAPATKTLAPKLVALNQIPVRNTEATFLRMIMDSTRMV